MRRILTFVFAVGILATFNNLGAQYTGTPFFTDTCFVMPGDHITPVQYDLGDSGVVVKGPFATGGYDQRKDDFARIYDEEFTEGWFIGWNRGGKKSSRNMGAMVSTNTTIYVTADGDYKLKMWKGATRSATFYVLDFATQDTLETLVVAPANQVATGDGTGTGAFAGFEYYFGYTATLTAGKYILNCGPLTDDLGAYTLVPAAYDSAYKVYPKLDADTNRVEGGNDITFTSDKDGMIYIVPNDLLTQNHSINYGVPFAELVKSSVESMAITANTPLAITTPTELDAVGSYVAVVSADNGFTSLSYAFSIVDLTAPTLTLTSAATLDYGQELIAQMNEPGTLVLVPDTAKKSDDLLALAYVKQAATTDVDSVIDFESAKLAGTYLLYAVDASKNPSDSILITINAPEIMLVDFNNNQVDNIQHSQDSTYQAGDVWVRANGADAAAAADSLWGLSIIPTEMAPAGYELTDSVLMLVADDNVTNFFSLLMFDLADSVQYDTNFHYLHVAMYYPTANTLGGATTPFKVWVKKNGPKGALVYKQASNTYFSTEVGGWVDFVFDMNLATDNYTAPVHGDTIDHIELSGYSIGDTSYIGSIVLGKFGTPRFESMADTVTVKAFTFTAANDSAEIGGNTLDLAVSGFMPLNATHPVVELSIAEGDTTNSSVAGMVFTSGDATGTATVVATVEDPAALAKSVKIIVWEKESAILTIDQSIEFIMVPNPAKDVLNVTVENSSNASLSIYNMAGQLVASQLFTNDNMVLNVSELNAGTYIVHIVNGEKVGTKKLIIQ